MVPYVATTQDVTVTVRPIYLDAPSDFFKKKFAFGYSVQIRNHGPNEVQLLRRHWIIEEGSGRLQDVEGEGVIGEQPVIAPGETHRYASRCVIHSFDGAMEGTYLMQRESGERFRAIIPRFPLHVAAN